MSHDFGEILNIKVPAGSRTLYIDLKQGADGTRCVSISEVSRSDDRERSRILFDEEFAAPVYSAIGAVVDLLARTHAAPKVSRCEENKRAYARCYQQWSAEEEDRLKRGYTGGKGVEQLAGEHERAPTAILSRLYQLGIIKTNAPPRW